VIAMTNLDWGAEEQSFPTQSIENWEFFIGASDESGESTTLQCRIEPKFARMIDEAIQDGKSKGLPLKTVSDFVRFTVLRGLRDFSKFISSENETLTHFLVLEEAAQREAHQTNMLTRVREAVTLLTQGLQILVSDGRNDYVEARSRINSFLIPILQLAGDQDFLMKMYVRELFSFPGFKRVVDSIVSSGTVLGPTIENSMKAYERITGESES
jgi:hypothetical protein